MKKLLLLVTLLILSSSNLQAQSKIDEPTPAKTDSLSAGITVSTSVMKFVIDEKQKRVDEIDTLVAKLEKEKADLIKEIALLKNITSYINSLKVEGK